MNPHHQDERAPFKSSSNEKEAEARENNKSLLNSTNTKNQKGEKSHDSNFERASSVENDDMGAYNTSSQHLLGADNSHPSLRNEENLNNREALADEPKSYLNANHKEVPTCPVCQRTFPSAKAMHGHLRSHPDRGYRGAVPPPTIAKEQLVQPSSTSAPQMKSSFSKQPVTTKIDHTSTPKRDPNRLIDPTTEAMNAAFILVYLRIGTSKRRANPSHGKEIYRSPKRKRENTEDDFKVTKDKEETEEHSRNGQGYEGEHHSSDHRIDGGDDNEYIEGSHLRPLSSLIKKKKKIKKLAGSYSCSVCDKIFSTHQALGGHMASHNKSKNIMDEVFTGNEANEVEQSHIEKPMIDKASKGSDSGIYKCKKCPQIFASGQALGGHQRKHYPLPDYSRKESNVVLDHGQKESNVAPDHSRKKSLLDHSRKAFLFSIIVRRKSILCLFMVEKKTHQITVTKQSNVVPHHGRKESNVVHNIDLNKSADFDYNLRS